MMTELYLAQELEASRKPLRPGKPGVAPFWNRYAKRFVYAPAFELPEVPGASAYRFRVAPAEGPMLAFTADVPWAPLSPVWSDVPHGLVRLTVEGLEAPGGASLGIAGELTFYRAPAFGGPYREPPPWTYREAGVRGLRALFEHRRFQCWLTENKPDPEMFLNCFAAKEMGASIRAMVAFARLTASESESRDAIQIARNIADFLIRHSEPPERPYPYFPPVYWINPENRIDDWHFEVARENQNQFMLSEPVRATFGYLDLYDATQDAAYFDAALRVAQTYLKTQRPDGTWPLVVDRRTGEELKSKPVIPTWVLFFFERLAKQYGRSEFAPAAERVAAWLLAHPAKEFRWDSQFEDVKIKEPYRKMAYEQAADTAYYLLTNGGDDAEKVGLAEELLRFVEDQFIVWEKPTEGWKTLEFPGGPTKYSQYAVDTWLAPAVIEQFGFVLVARATAVVMRVYAKAYEVTGKDVYLAKARSLANTLVATQQYHGGGEIPSFPMTSEQIVWTNNSVYTALFLLEFGEATERAAER